MGQLGTGKGRPRGPLGCGCPGAGPATGEMQSVPIQATRPAWPGAVRLPNSLFPAGALLAFPRTPSSSALQQHVPKSAVAPLGCFHDRFLYFINRGCTECKLSWFIKQPPCPRHGCNPFPPPCPQPQGGLLPLRGPVGQSWRGSGLTSAQSCHGRTFSLCLRPSC